MQLICPRCEHPLQPDHVDMARRQIQCSCGHRDTVAGAFTAAHVQWVDLSRPPPGIRLRSVNGEAELTLRFAGPARTLCVSFLAFWTAAIAPPVILAFASGFERGMPWPFAVLFGLAVPLTTAGFLFAAWGRTRLSVLEVRLYYSCGIGSCGRRREIGPAGEVTPVIIGTQGDASACLELRGRRNQRIRMMDSQLLYVYTWLRWTLRAAQPPASDKDYPHENPLPQVR